MRGLAVPFELSSFHPTKRFTQALTVFESESLAEHFLLNLSNYIDLLGEDLHCTKKIFKIR